MNVLAIDTGGTHVKILATGEKTHREFSSGPTLTARRMVAAVKKLAGDWKYDVISIGEAGFGCWFADLPANQLKTNDRIVFTFLWQEGSEGRLLRERNLTKRKPKTAKSFSACPNKPSNPINDMNHHPTTHSPATHSPAKHGPHSGSKPYFALLVSLGLSFIVMYFIMYSMADRWSHVYLNLSNVYMTGLMAVSMIPIMLVTMPGMFPNRKGNAALWGASLVLLVLFWMLLRTEAGVRDRQFLRAMIPHHAAAIQMVNESSLTDPRVKKLGEDIVASQEREIAEMKALLEERK